MNVNIRTADMNVNIDDVIFAGLLHGEFSYFMEIY